MRLISAVINSIFPTKCVSCAEIIDRDEFLCEFCFEMIEKLDFSKRCPRCGLLKKQCECKKRVFHFIGLTAPFANGKFSRSAMYRFKFGRHSRIADFFAQEMAKAIKQCYTDIKFDAIAFVPMPTFKQLQRGFNQSEELAKRLSKILGLPLCSRLLCARYKFTKQHSLSLKDRFENVKGIYSFNYKVNGKCILLVDDIKTTGATIDACAKQLLLAGADKVYCITGLITEPKKGKE